MSASTSHEASPFGLVAAQVAKVQLGRRTRMLLERGDSPRSGEGVWRNSYTEGTIEDRIWKPINDGTTRGGRRWTQALLKAARGLAALRTWLGKGLVQEGPDPPHRKVAWP